MLKHVETSGKDKNMKCSICGDNVEQFGNNPYPLCAQDDNESRCCDICNMMVIKARIALTRQDKISEGDTVAIFFAKESSAPTKMIGEEGKFLAGVVDSIIQTDKKIKYMGSWGNFTLDSETDSFVKV